MPTDDPISAAIPPGGKLFEQHVNIQQSQYLSQQVAWIRRLQHIAIRQSQDVTLQMSWLRRLLAGGGEWARTVAAVAARLRAAAARPRRRGRPPKYDHAAIITAIEACALRGVDDLLNLFAARAKLECDDRHVNAPGTTQLTTKFCRPFWQAAQERRPNY
jgi:hypothetical protein